MQKKGVITWTKGAITRSSRRNNVFYYIPHKVYKVKLPLALSNISHLTESILAQSHDDAKNP